MREQQLGRWGFWGAVALIAACSSGGGGFVGDTSAGPGLFGQVVDATGSPVSGAQVVAGSGSATTGADGRYALRTSAGAQVVRVDRDGFLPAIKRVTVGEDAPAALGVTLLAEASPQPLDAGAGGEVQGDRGARAVVPAGALVDGSGAPVEGMVQVFLTPIDPSMEVELAAAPGELTARGSSGADVKLESFGMLDVTIRKDGAKLQLADGQRMEIAIPAPATPAGELPAEVPLWSFDEADGRWRQEGTLALDTTTGAYVGEIAHMSFWNADQELDTTCITGQVLDADTGAPVSGARVMMSGVGYFGVDASTANAEGRFVIFARRSATARVTAYHAETGADQRNIEAGDTQVSPPVAPGDARCTDGGTWRVRRGEVRLPDGSTVSCNTNQLADFAGCLPTLVEITRCHNPQGTCTSTGLFSYSFSNGAAVEIDIDTETGLYTQTFFGPGGARCGSQIISTGAGSGEGAVEGGIRLIGPNGEESSYGYTSDLSGDINYICENGTTRLFTKAQQEQLQACAGSGSEGCEGPAENPNQGATCTDTAECGGGGLECCFGVCLSESLCNIGTCGEDSECSGDNDVCCKQEGQDRGYCANRLSCTGECRSDAECGQDALCCDSACVYGREVCEGQCSTSADCDDGGFCCPSDPTFFYCAESEQRCYESAACSADADCGSGGDLVCCDQDGSASCQTVESCYGNVPCADTTECHPGLTCCDRFGQGYCLAETTCTNGASCGGDADCSGNQVCCGRPDYAPDGPICLERETCETTPPCTSEAECESGQLCCTSALLGDAFDYCLRPEECTYLQPCTTDGDCLGQSVCCSFGGAELVCFIGDSCGN